MSAVNCPNCGNSVEEQGGRCPRCGKPMDNSAAATKDAAIESGKLNKVARVIGVLLFCGSVASCSDILFHATKDMNHVLGMNLAFFGMILGILLTFCASAFTTR